MSFIQSFILHFITSGKLLFWPPPMEVGTSADAATGGGSSPSGEMPLGGSVAALKVALTAAIFLSALLSVLAPLLVLHRSESLFSVGNMAASGVLLSAALVHQLADATRTLDGVLGTSTSSSGAPAAASAPGAAAPRRRGAAAGTTGRRRGGLEQRVRRVHVRRPRHVLILVVLKPA